MSSSSCTNIADLEGPCRGEAPGKRGFDSSPGTVSPLPSTGILGAVPYPEVGMGQEKTEFGKQQLEFRYRVKPTYLQGGEEAGGSPGEKRLGMRAFGPFGY